MSTELHTTEFANFFVPHQIATAVPLGPAPVDCNLALSTGFIGTGLVLAVLYNLFQHRHGRHTKNSSTVTPVRWIEYPNYVSPTMDLFVEDDAPFGFSSLLSCPKDAEHLERAFDLLRYQYFSKKLGVPSAVSRPSPLRSLRTLGNTSSGSSFDFWFGSQLLSGSNVSFAQGGPQESYDDSLAFVGEEKIVYLQSTASYPISPPTSTRLPPLSGHEPKSARKAVWTALLAVSIAVLGFFAKRGLHYPSSPEPLTTLDGVSDILENGDSENDLARDKRCFGNFARRVGLGSRQSKAQLDPYWAGIGTDSLVVAIQVFCLLATRGRPHPPSSEPYTIPSFDNIWELLEDEESYRSYIDKAPWNSAPVPSSRMVLGVLMDTERLLLEDDPLSDSYTPYVALFFPDSHAWSDAPLVEDAPVNAPVEIAAHFDALREAFSGLWTRTEMSPLDVGHLVMLWMAMFLYIGLRVTAFLVTGRFGCRGIRRLVDQFKSIKTLDPILAVEIANIIQPDLGDPLVEAPEGQETEPSAGRSESSGLTTPNDIFDGDFVPPLPALTTSKEAALAEHVDDSSMTMSMTPLPSCSTTRDDHLAGLVVETYMAPTANDENHGVRDDGDGWNVVRRKRGRKGKGIATDTAPEGDAEASRCNAETVVSSPLATLQGDEGPCVSPPL